MTRRPGVRESTTEADVPERDVARHLVQGTASHAIFLLDTDATITTWPAPAENLYGYEPAAILGRHVSDLFADGESTADDTSDGFLVDAKEETVEVEHWHQQADGSVFWGTLTLSPLENEQFQGYAVVSQDTTEQKEYKRMLERQNDRLKEFTDILAHDLQSPLTVIDGRLTLYQETGDEEHLETVVETTERMARLVDDLLRVARQGDVVTDPEPTDVEDVIETAWRVIEATSRATLSYEAVPPLSSDPDRLCELFENLFRNAVQHGGEKVAIRVGPSENGFYVADDGDGILDEHKADVFDHGFTTTTDGSGYGLSVVRTIVNAHGWDIVATDAAGGGTRFEITGISFLD